MKKVIQRNGAFTLIELLAVVAIILLLLSLLVPALNKARDKAYQIVCESNVRQVMAAIINYASDNDGSFPDPDWRMGTDQISWLSSRNVWNSPEDLHGGLIWKYTGNVKVYRCPADPQPQSNDITFTWIKIPGNTRMVTSYNMNGSVCGYGKLQSANAANVIKAFGTPNAKMWDTFRLTEFRPNDIMYWEGDETTDQNGWWWDGANYPYEGISARHFGAGTMASADGHVERILTPDYYALVNEGKYNRLRNSPAAKGCASNPGNGQDPKAPCYP